MSSAKERPILFSGPMVRAILEGRKTQTRRVMKPQPTTDGYWWTWKQVSCNGETGLRDGLPCLGPCPYGKLGDRLWVRETLRAVHDTKLLPDERMPIAAYAADGSHCWSKNRFRVPWRWERGVLPSIHLPRILSRITLEITDVRVQRLQDISEADAVAEGCGIYSEGEWLNQVECGITRRKRFEELWQSINGPDSWSANPWVWALTFKRVKS